MQVNNSYGYDPNGYQPVVDGNAAAANLEGFAYTATNAICQAAITFTSQHMGACKHRRILRVMGCCYLVTFLVAAFFSGALLLLRDPLLALYGVRGGAPGTAEAVAQETAYIRMKLTYIPYFQLAFMEVGGGVVRGLGRSITSTVVSLVGACLFRIAWITLVFRQVFAVSGAEAGLRSIFISYPISWGLTAAIHLTCALLVLRGLLRRNAHC
jgi:Na+-driven multidrug efflux pump